MVARKNLSQSNLMEIPEFFKIYLPEHNSKQLSIPPSFIRNFKGNIPKKVILKNSLEKSWDLELEENGGKLLINKGWEDYVRSHSLVRGDFLIFKYHGNDLFTVKVFGLNGCPKDETTVTRQEPSVRTELVEEEEEARLEQEANDLTVSCEPTNLDNGMEVENRSPSESSEAMKCDPGRTEEFSKVRFTKLLERKRYYEMGIPLGVIADHKIVAPEVNKPEKIILRNQEGKPMTATFRRRLDSRVEIAKGWRDFSKYNNIHFGDELDFEIILDKQRKVREIILLQANRRKEEPQLKPIIREVILV